MKSSLPTNFTWLETHLANILTSCSSPLQDNTWIMCISHTEVELAAVFEGQR